MKKIISAAALALCVNFCAGPILANAPDRDMVETSEKELDRYKHPVVTDSIYNPDTYNKYIEYTLNKHTLNKDPDTVNKQYTYTTKNDTDMDSIQEIKSMPTPSLSRTPVTTTTDSTQPEITPPEPEIIPPEITPPEIIPPEFTPPEIIPPEFTPPSGLSKTPATTTFRIISTTGSASEIVIEINEIGDKDMKDYEVIGKEVTGTEVTGKEVPGGSAVGIGDRGGPGGEIFEPPVQNLREPDDPYMEEEEYDPRKKKLDDSDSETKQTVTITAQQKLVPIAGEEQENEEGGSGDSKTKQTVTITVQQKLVPIAGEEQEEQEEEGNPFEYYTGNGSGNREYDEYVSKKGLKLPPLWGKPREEEPEAAIQFTIFQTDDGSTLRFPNGTIYPINASVPLKLNGTFETVAVDGGFPIGIGRDAQIGYLSGQGANLQILGNVENAEFGKKTTVRLLDGANVQNAILQYCRLTAQKGSTLGNVFGQSENAVLNVQDGVVIGSVTMGKPGFVTGVPYSKLVGDTVKEAAESKDSGSRGGSSGGGGGNNSNGGGTQPTPQQTGAAQALAELFGKLTDKNSVSGSYGIRFAADAGSVTNSGSGAAGTVAFTFDSGWDSTCPWDDGNYRPGDSGASRLTFSKADGSDSGGFHADKYANFVLGGAGGGIPISVLSKKDSPTGSTTSLSDYWEILSGSGPARTTAVTGPDGNQYNITFTPAGNGSSVTVNVSAVPV